MGLFDFGKKKREKIAERNIFLLQWQNEIMHDKSVALIYSEEQLISISQVQATRDLEIVNDCSRILQSTTNPDTFFSRLDLLMEKLDHLCVLEKYIKFSGTSPTIVYETAKKDYQEVIYNFIIRYFSETFEKAEKMKTDKGKISKYQKFYDSLQQYYSLMNDDNKRYIDYKYKRHTNLLKDKKEE